MTATVDAETPPPAPRRNWFRRRGHSPPETVLALVLMAPSLAIFVAFFYLPFAQLLGWGRYDSVRNGAEYESVGTEQYGAVLGGADFWEGVWNSVQFVLYTVPAGLVLGTLLAVAANRRLRGIKIFQTIFASTVATSVAVSSVIFLFLLNPRIGVFKVNWLADQGMAMFAVSLPAIWQNLGLSFIIVLAGLQAIPDEVVEASRLDGYGAVRRFFRITVPLLSPVLLFLVVVLVIFGLQAYAQPDILTSGGPGDATETLVFKIFANNTPTNITEGAVLSVGLFVVTAVITALQFGILERRVHYGY